MNKIEIEIPDGKKAKWVNGVLTLVDEKPQDITERIKTVEDACNALGDKHPLVTHYYRAVAAFKYEPMTKDLIAGLKLRIICAALNEGWMPKFYKDEHRYHPWFCMYSKEDYNKELDDEEKKHCVPMRSSASACVNGGFAYVYVNSEGVILRAEHDVQLALKTGELAEYCGKQFIDIWCDYLFS